MSCSGSVGLFRRGCVDGGRRAVFVGEGGGRRGRNAAGPEDDTREYGGQPPHSEEAHMPRLTFAEIAQMTGGQVIQGGDVVTS